MKYLKKNGDRADDDPLTARVIGLAIDIHKELGPGFTESIYHRALEIELAAAGLPFVSEAPLVVKYKGRVLGAFAADLIVEDRLLMELKALETLPIISEVQVANYLKATTIEVGLILNFGTAPFQIKRKFRNRLPVDHDLRLQEV